MAVPSSDTDPPASAISIPMPTPTVPALPLTAYKILSFDVYGTLIEYKAHILAAFSVLLARLPSSSIFLDRTPLSSEISDCATRGQIEFLKLFQRLEDAIKLEKPVRRFDEILVEIWWRVARTLEVTTSQDEARAFGSVRNIASWSPFEGTVAALHRLSRRYRLVALSNVDRFAWDVTTSTADGGGVDTAEASVPTTNQQDSRDSNRGSLGEIAWWKVLTAEDFGDDALDRADEVKLETMLASCTTPTTTQQTTVASSTSSSNKRTVNENEDVVIGRHEVLHVAQSLGHDHAPAKRLGLASVFLVGDGRRWGKEQESRMAVERDLVGYAWRCRDLTEFAALVERAFSSAEEGGFKAR